MGPLPDPWKRVHAQLSHGNLDADDVAQLLDDLGPVRDKPWAMRVFTKGISWPDGVLVHAVVGRDQFDELVELMLGTPRLDSIKVFPKGIVNPEVYVAELEFS